MTLNAVIIHAACMHYYSKLFSTNVEVYDIAVHICCCGVALLQAGLAIILCSITESLPGYKYCRSVAFLQAGIAVTEILHAYSGIQHCCGVALL